MKRILTTDSNERGDYDFGKNVPSLKYRFETSELKNILGHKNAFGVFSYDTRTNEVCTWLLNGLGHLEFGQLCAYFLERELGCELGAGSLNECGHVVFHGKKRISQRKTEQLTLIANQSLALEGVECIASGAQTMFLIGLNSSNDATREESMKQIENVWGREKILEIYDKYFFDPDGGWEEFQLTIRSKEANRLAEEFRKEKSRPIFKESKENRAKLLLEVLRGVRKTLADENRTTENKIFSDRVIKAMAEHGPRRKSAFLLINGVTRKKYEEYGEPFLLAIIDFQHENGELSH